MPLFQNVPILKKMFDLASTMAIAIIISAIIGLILAFPVMWLWNFVFINIGPLQINVFQAWALTILTGILFNKGK